VISDGDLVSFAGMHDDPVFPGIAAGDRGTVLSASPGVGHILWRTGSRTGRVDIIPVEDLRVAARGVGVVDQALDDSLEVGPRVAVREVYDQAGEGGLVTALAEAGALSGVAQIAEDLTAMAAGRVRADLASVLSQLDPDDAEAVVSTVTAACMREALGA
jgi:hypothetical protein